MSGDVPEPRARKAQDGPARPRGGRFIGYSGEYKAYRIWLYEKGTVVTNRDVKFFELDAPYSMSDEDDTEAFIPANDRINSSQSFINLEWSAPREEESQQPKASDVEN